MDNLERFRQLYKQGKGFDDVPITPDASDDSKSLGGGGEEPFPGNHLARYTTSGNPAAEGAQTHKTSQGAEWVYFADEERVREGSEDKPWSMEEVERVGREWPEGKLPRHEQREKREGEEALRWAEGLSDKKDIGPNVGDYKKFIADGNSEGRKRSYLNPEHSEHGRFSRMREEGWKPEQIHANLWDREDKSYLDPTNPFHDNYKRLKASGWRDEAIHANLSGRHIEEPELASELKRYQQGDPRFKKMKPIQKIASKTMAALAGWWLGGEIADINRGMGQPTPSQQREFERQIQQAMRKKKLSKENILQKLQSYFSTQNDDNDTYVRRKPLENAVTAPTAEEELLKVLGAPPYAGARFDPTSHRWTKPENYGQTYVARGGKKRIRGTGTGVHERSISGHGKGRIRGEGAGAKAKGETHLSATRRKEGFTHSDLQRKSPKPRRK